MASDSSSSNNYTLTTDGTPSCERPSIAPFSQIAPPFDYICATRTHNGQQLFHVHGHPPQWISSNMISQPNVPKQGQVCARAAHEMKGIYSNKPPVREWRFDSIPELATRLAQKLQDHIYLRGKDPGQLKVDIATILFSIPKELITALCDGNLSSVYIGTHLEQLLHDFLKTKDRPTVYMIELAHRETGQAPTIAEMRKLHAHVTAYLGETDLETARKIDGVLHHIHTQSDIRSGERRYLRNDAARERLRIFLDNLEKLLDKLYELDWNPEEPSPFTLRYIGFTQDPERRYNEHRNHVNSSVLLEILDAAIHAFLSDDKYCQTFNVIWTGVGCEDDGGLAEVLFTELAGSGIETGAGLNAKPAGKRSVFSGGYVTPHDKDRVKIVEDNIAQEGARQNRSIHELSQRLEALRMSNLRTTLLMWMIKNAWTQSLIDMAQPPD